MFHRFYKPSFESFENLPLNPREQEIFDGYAADLVAIQALVIVSDPKRRLPDEVQWGRPGDEQV